MKGSKPAPPDAKRPFNLRISHPMADRIEVHALILRMSVSEAIESVIAEHVPDYQITEKGKSA